MHLQLWQWEGQMALFQLCLDSFIEGRTQFPCIRGFGINPKNVLYLAFTQFHKMHNGRR